jgi:predicted transcriptional regulator/plasmid maintenance system antidote protein VapI
MAARQAQLGGRLRRLRQEQKLSQIQMAERLGISASYLNLIEHNQRALTVPVLLRLAQRFDVDLQSFTAEEDARLLSELMEIFADPLFDSHDLKASELKDLIEESPNLSRALLTLYQAYRSAGISSEPREEDDRPLPLGMPTEEVGDFIQSRGNYFPDLESAAEELWRDGAIAAGALGNGGLWSALVTVLATRHAVDVEIVPASHDDGVLRHYDPITRRLSLSEILPLPSRHFHLAHQIALLGHRPLLLKLAAAGKFTTGEADQLAVVALANYFAGAVLMPYRPFLDAATSCRYDLDILMRRFGVSFEQVCHRLTALRRPGANGIPFHFLRVDRAGNVTKRFSASSLTIARFGGVCPRWNVFDAFETPGTMRTQISQMPDGVGYFALARTVEAHDRSALTGHNSRRLGRHAISIGCPLAHARELVYADGADLRDEAAVPVGVNCRVCERANCADRLHPSPQQRLVVDDNRRLLSLYTASR